MAFWIFFWGGGDGGGRSPAALLHSFIGYVAVFDREDGAPKQIASLPI